MIEKFTTKRRILFAVTTIIICFSVFRVYIFSDKTAFNEGDSIRITARIRNEPVVYSDSQYLRLYNLKIYLPVYPIISYGDKIVISGEVTQGKLTNVKLIEIERNKNIIYVFREKLQNVYKKTLPIKEAALVAGMTAGTKFLIDKNFWEILKKTGTAHIVVASGTNVVLISSFMMGLLAGMINRRKAVLIVIGTIWFYALLAGFDAPIIRASIMGTIAMIGIETGRIYNVTRALMASFIIMLLINPLWLTDAGFWLSFASSMSLIILSPKTAGIIKKIKKARYIPKAITEGFVTSISAQVGVMPVLIIFFGQISLIAPLVNALILWTVVPITAIGALGGILGVIFLPLGKLVLLLAYPLLKYFVFITAVFS